MSSYSNVLFDCLVSDLSRALPTLGWGDLYEGNLRKKAWPGISPKQFACLSLLDSIFKKFEDDKNEKADKLALDKFIECNNRCSDFTSIDTSDMTDILAISLGEFKNAFWRFFYQSDLLCEVPESDISLKEVTLNGSFHCGFPMSILDDLSNDVIEHMATGPGASIGATGQSFYHKIAASRLSCSERSLYSLYKSETSRFPLWAETEKIRSATYDGCYEVPGSKLCYVPKSIDISRTICTEPSLNMLFQKGVGKRLELVLRKRFGIDLRSQPSKNRELARIGSLDGTYGTIDLSSASDTISIGLLKEICPPEILKRLMSFRSPSVVLPDGKTVQLHMVSSMGNAFTFPLQTILFSSVVIGVYRALNIKVEYPFGTDLGNFAVFGDDIIVRREAYDYVIDILGRLGFKVNLDKSFNDGSFRESCGSDFHCGINVRGIYCHSLKTKHDLYSLINRLNVWSANHGVYLKATIQNLMDKIGYRFNPIPPWEDDMAGVKVPLSLADLNQLGIDLNTFSIVYKRYQTVASTITMLNIGTREKIRKGVIHNPPGVLLAAIGGYLREGKIHTRVDSPFFKKRIAIAPGWDYIDLYQSTFTAGGWHRWKSSFVKINLGSGLSLNPSVIKPTKVVR